MRQVPLMRAATTKVGHVLRGGPDEAGDAKGDDVGHEQGEATAVLVYDGAADQGGKDLRGQAEAGDEADALVGDAEGEHIDRHERHEHVVGHTEHGLGEHAGARIAA